MKCSEYVFGVVQSVRVEEGKEGAGRLGEASRDECVMRQRIGLVTAAYVLAMVAGLGWLWSTDRAAAPAATPGLLRATSGNALAAGASASRGATDNRREVNPDAIADLAPDSGTATPAALRPGGTPLAIMVIHPHCPCTRSAMAVLAREWTARTDRTARLVFLVSGDPDAPAASLDGPNVDAARRVPDATVCLDPDGGVSKTLGATASGYTLVYDAEGRLSYFGGMTASRSHGDASTGAELLRQVLDGQAGAIGAGAGKAGGVAGPTFGCLLRSGGK